LVNNVSSQAGLLGIPKLKETSTNFTFGIGGKVSRILVLH
jgi:iron complex outermembrane receptor protein